MIINLQFYIIFQNYLIFSEILHNCPEFSRIFRNYMKLWMIYIIFNCRFLTIFLILADLKDVSIANPSRPMDGTTIRPLHNAFWNLDSFCIYQQGVVDIMPVHTWSLGVLDYVIFSVVNEIIYYLRSFKFRKIARRQG